MEGLGTLGGDFSNGSAVNDLGQVVGPTRNSDDELRGKLVLLGGRLDGRALRAVEPVAVVQ